MNQLFDWLNNPQAERTLDDTDPLYGFRYVNGGLFSERLGFPRCTKVMRDSLLFCCDFSWARISPAVFGSLFQGVMEDRARRQQGAHYTSERDIMKVLRSLFLDELRAEFEQLKRDRSTRRRANRETFHQKLRSLRFLDPACGCGNFLVLAYRELRLLEIEVLKESYGAQQQELNVRDLCKVDVDQFHGIEYSEWPVRIAEVALWLMDHQMNAQAAEAFGQSFDRLPLRSSPHIVQGNALRVDWNAVLPREKCSYVLGNPPFVGAMLMSQEQRADMVHVAGEMKGVGVLDYVACWYLKAARYIEGTRIPVAFVSTSSITQGEQVGILWGELFQRYRLKIQFAHRTFAWSSEARGKANVHVVIIGFAGWNDAKKLIWDYHVDAEKPTISSASNISPYLVEGSDLFLTNRSNPLCDVPRMVWGSQPRDGGNLLMTTEEKAELIAVEPGAKRWIRPYTGADEFINGIERWCLWLVNIPPGELRRLPRVLARVDAVRAMRSASRAEATRKKSDTPTLFAQIAQPETDYLLIPLHSSETRKYVPIGFMPAEFVASNACSIVPDATPYEFGVLTSSMHMAWMKAVCGRLESRYRYAKDIVYNNFPWPSPTPAQRERVEEKARAMLAAREPHLPPRGLATLADLYDPNTMPRDLLRAHAELDRAVERCYRAEPFHSDRERVEHLFRLYEQLSAPLLPATLRRRGRGRGPATTAPRQPRPRNQRTPGLPSQSRPER